jgi:hypothetical protein
MKKRIVYLLLVVSMIFQTQMAFAVELPPAESESKNGIGSFEQDVEFLGEVLADGLISAIVPTRVEFAIDMASSSWNKAISPDFGVTNICANTTTLLDVSVLSAEIASDVPISFRDYSAYTSSYMYTSSGFDGSREIWLAIAPKTTYSSEWTLENYWLGGYVNSSLTEDLSSNDVATYNIYGSASPNGWSESEPFSVNVVFKVAKV